MTKPADVTAALELARFDLEQPETHMGSAYMSPQPGYGDWVKYEDAAALAAALADATQRAESAEFPDRKAMSKRIREQRKAIRRLQATEAVHWRFVDVFATEKRDMDALVAELTAKLDAVSDPDLLFSAMDDVRDMDSTVTDYANAASKAIRALIGGE